MVLQSSWNRKMDVQRIFSFMTMTMPIMELMYNPNTRKSNR